MKVLLRQLVDAASKGTGVKSRLLLAITAAYISLRGNPTETDVGPSKGRGSFATRILYRRVRIKMSDGAKLEMRLIDLGGPMSVWVDQDYAWGGENLAAARAIVDIGAHVGSFGVWAGRRAPDAKLICVEPNPEVQGFLETNLRSNVSAAQIFSAAITPAEGEVYIQGLSSPLGAHVTSSKSDPEARRVHGLSLSQILKAADSATIDVLKIDCEGLEYEILEVADPVELRRVRSIYIEYHPVSGRGPDDLVRLLSGMGYTVRTRGGTFGMIHAIRPS